MSGRQSSGIDSEKLAAHREAEAVAGWPLLGACPSTFAAGATMSLVGIPVARRGAFAAELTVFEREVDIAAVESMEAWTERAEEFPMVADYLAAITGGGARSLGRVPVKVIAGVRNDTAVGGIEGWIRQVGLEGTDALPPPALATGIDELVPVAPRVLRRLVTAMMGERFGAEAVKESRELDRFDMAIGDVGLRVLVGYAPSGGRSIHQLQYDVRLPGADRFISYESLWRTPARWDYLTETNAGRSIDHLGELIATLAALT